MEFPKEIENRIYNLFLIAMKFIVTLLTADDKFLLPDFLQYLIIFYN